MEGKMYNYPADILRWNCWATLKNLLKMNDISWFDPDVLEVTIGDKM